MELDFYPALPTWNEAEERKEQEQIAVLSPTIGICRIFGLSLTWLQAFAHSLWIQTPKDLGLSGEIIDQVEEVQVFGIQMDELWSFVENKKNKRWIWVAYDPSTKLVIAHHIG